MIRERDGKTLPGVFHSEVEALTFIRRQVPRGTELYADEAGAWNASARPVHAAPDQPSGSLQPRRRDEINTN